jgi:ribonuclease BN (tRNA processing enzyme)
MQLRFIGCGDALGSGGRHNTCFHVTGERVNFLIDCGASSLPALKRQGVARDDIDLILITHFHGDHFGGLPFLLLDAQFARRTRPLVIAGPEGIETRLTQLMEALFENSSQTKQRFDLSVVALRPEVRCGFGAVNVMPLPVVHGESGGPFLGYRVEAEGRVIAYTADTEWTETLIPLGRDADLLIAEAYTYDNR